MCVGQTMEAVRLYAIFFLSLVSIYLLSEAPVIEGEDKHKIEDRNVAVMEHVCGACSECVKMVGIHYCANTDYCSGQAYKREVINRIIK